jgi:hypothetical protein
MILVTSIDRVSSGMLQWCFMGIAVAVLSVHAVSAKRHLDEWRSNGVGGYATRAWTGSPTLASADSLAGRIYSNAHDFLALRGIHATMLPSRTQYNSDEPATPLAKVKQSWPRGRTYVVWFDQSHRSYVYDASELAQVLNVSLERRLADGAIYRVDN